MIISFFFSTLILFMLLAIIFGAPYVPSKHKNTRVMIELLNLKKGETVYDLGSGDGRLLIATAKQGAKAVGVELNLYLVLWTKLQALLQGVSKNVHVSWGNLWWTSVRDADAVTLYFLPHIMPKLVKKLKKELKPGTRVVSNAFSIQEFTLVKKELVGKEFVYLYKV